MIWILIKYVKKLICVCPTKVSIPTGGERGVVKPGNPNIWTFCMLKSGNLFGLILQTRKMINLENRMCPNANDDALSSCVVFSSFCGKLYLMCIWAENTGVYTIFWMAWKYQYRSKTHRYESEIIRTTAWVCVYGRVSFVSEERERELHDLTCMGKRCESAIQRSWVWIPLQVELSCHGWIKLLKIF